MFDVELLEDGLCNFDIIQKQDNSTGDIAVPAALHKAARALIDLCVKKTDSRPGGLGGVVRDLGEIL